MSTADIGADGSDRTSWPAIGRVAAQIGAGWLFWLAFLLMLEPGNVVRAAQTGVKLDPGLEAMRILAASTLGSAAAPLLVVLGRRLPVEGRAWLVRGVLHLGALIGLALALIGIGHGLAPLVRPGGDGDTLAQQIGKNTLLMVAAMAGFDAAVHWLRRRRARATPPAPPPTVKTLAVRERGRVVLVPVADIDWVEAQGNYLALHSLGRTHLLRETLGGLQAQLDPTAFARIHRRLIVNLARVRDVRALGGGDAVVVLEGGRELRASRSFRPALDRGVAGATTPQRIDPSTVRIVPDV